MVPNLSNHIAHGNNSFFHQTPHLCSILMFQKPLGNLKPYISPFKTQISQSLWQTKGEGAGGE